MLVAQLGTVCGPESSATVWSGPFVNDGGSFTGLTVRMNVSDMLCVPLVTVTVMVVVPVVAVAVAEKAAETLHVGVQVGGFGVNTTVTPEGNAERLNVTGAATPAVKVALRVSVPAAPPWVIDKVAGEA